MSKNKIVFKAEINGSECELAVVRPSPKVLTEAQKYYNRAFKDALSSGALLREALDRALRDQGLWDDDKQEEYTNLQKKFKQLEVKLARGRMKLSEGRQTALEMRKLRVQMRMMLADRTNLDSHSAQGQADNVRFNYLVSACTVYNKTGENVFINLDDYLGKSTEEYAFQAANNLSNIIYDLDDDFEKKLPENQFLVKYKFADKELRLVNDKGDFIDEDGRKVDAEGRYVDANGNFVDAFGNPIDAKGEYVLDAGPFLDDEGNPVN